jgi:hypothetical protein
MMIIDTRRSAALLAVAVIMSGLAACSGGSTADVVVSPAAVARFQIAPAGTGPVLAAVDQAVVVERRATVTSVDVVEGQEVHQGEQLLAVFTIGDSSAIATATNQLRADEKELASVRARDGVGAASTLALLDQIAVDRQALTDLKSTPLSIAAPADGHVSGLAVQAGAEVTRTDVVLHVVDDRRLRVTVPLTASYRGLITTGQNTLLTIPGGSGRSFEATVIDVGPSTLDPKTSGGTVPVTVELPKPDDPIALGTTAYVRFPIDYSAPVAVNSLAVLGKDQQPYVFVVKDGHVEQRAVVTGPSDGALTEIVSGVAPDDEVVISGGQQLLSGDPVTTTRSDSS